MNNSVLSGSVAKRLARPFCAAAILAAMAWPAQSSTPQGEFAVEGAGLAKCPAFLEARTARSDAYSRFIGYVEGYMTAANRYAPETFDLSPYQTGELFGMIIENHCKSNPDDQLYYIVQSLAAQLDGDRLVNRSDLMRINGSETGPVAVYEEVVRRMQQRLTEENLYRGEADGQFDEELQRSIENYQAAVGLQPSGMPDTLTLWILFSPQQAG